MMARSETRRAYYLTIPFPVKQNAGNGHYFLKQAWANGGEKKGGGDLAILTAPSVLLG